MKALKIFLYIVLAFAIIYNGFCQIGQLMLIADQNHGFTSLRFVLSVSAAVLLVCSIVIFLFIRKIRMVSVVLMFTGAICVLLLGYHLFPEFKSNAAMDMSGERSGIEPILKWHLPAIITPITALGIHLINMKKKRDEERWREQNLKKSESILFNADKSYKMKNLD